MGSAPKRLNGVGLRFAAICNEQNKRGGEDSSAKGSRHDSKCDGCAATLPIFGPGTARCADVLSVFLHELHTLR